MTLDDKLKPILELLSAVEMPPLDTVPAPAMREMMEANALSEEKREVARTEDQVIAGPEGNIPVRVYWPSEEKNLPVLVYYHGGGFVIGTLETHDPLCRELAMTSDAIVVSVDYRLAPEHPYPAAPNDCYNAFCWVAENADALGGDPNRIAIGGDSAGGNLAAVVALMAKDKAGPSIAHQVLFYPVTDFNFDTQSYRDNAEGYFLTTEMMKWFWGHYLSDDNAGDEIYASPLRAKDLGNLPSATVLTAGYDPLRDEGEAYAERLKKAGNEINFLRYPGMIHGFVSMLGVVSQAEEAVAIAAQDMQRAFGRTS